MVPRISTTTLVGLGVSLLAAAGAQAKSNVPCPADPYADPSTDLCNPLRYIPSQAVNIVALVLYFLVAFALTWQNWKHRANYMLCLVIGTYTEALGFVFRLVLRKNPHSQGIYIIMYLLIVLSPCAFLAGDYILLGRLTGHLNADRHLRPLRPKFVSWTFIVSDVITFLIQAAGGGLSISKDVTTAKMGGRIFLAGIAAQMASFILFTIMWAIFAIRVQKDDKVLWAKEGWKPLHWALGFTCACFLIRSVYRTVELSEGYIGKLATHEVYFLALDTLPLFLGVASYTYFWPGKYITPETRIAHDVAQPMEEVGVEPRREPAGMVPSEETSVKTGSGDKI